MITKERYQKALAIVRQYEAQQQPVITDMEVRQDSLLSELPVPILPVRVLNSIHRYKVKYNGTSFGDLTVADLASINLKKFENMCNVGNGAVEIVKKITSMASKELLYRQQN